eukprot:11155147-Lingulodinium_polyedra.AAC.1
MAGAPAGRWVFVLSILEDGTPPLWRRRLVLGRLGCLVIEYGVCTPDGGVCFESYEAGPEISAVRVSEDSWPPPSR